MIHRIFKFAGQSVSAQTLVILGARIRGKTPPKDTGHDSSR